MKHVIRLFLFFLLLAPAAWGHEAPTPAAAASDMTAKVDEIFAPWSSRESPGCAVAVGENGRTLLSRAYGMADLEHDAANTPDTIFEAGSVAKQLTTAAVLLLAQQGKLSVQDDVRKHFPEVPDYGTPITIDHLIHHTSGLRDWGAVVGLAGWPRGTRIHNHSHVLDVISRQKALNYAPGAEFSYTNSGYNLLAIIVERVSGESFSEFTRKNLFEPLGMTRTQWRDDFTRIVKGRAIAYAGNDGKFHSEMPFENVFGNGGLLTTVGDLLLWNENLVHGKVGGPGFIEEMHRRGRLTDGREIEYARGLFVLTWKGIPEVSHGGATAGYRAFLARYPEQKISLAVLCNAAEADPGDLAHRTIDLFLAGRTKAPAPTPTAVAIASEVLAARAGLYRNVLTGEPMKVEVKEGRLRTNRGTEMIPLSDSQFHVDENRKVAFDVGPDGRPKTMRLIHQSGEVVSFEPVAEVSLTPDRLAEYAGEYRSDEAEVTYRVLLEDGKLVLRIPLGSFPLAPSYADAFQ
ncbi:MAG TPA: serine hydrolase domain-containing protein, partial [Rubrobacter sp.]|nr:serine hydrolase domain-containing protein [Rubrobacter sp.]